jgi:hypothetical protein
VPVPDWGVFQPLRDLVGMKVFSPCENARPAIRLGECVTLQALEYPAIVPLVHGSQSLL